MRFCVAFFSLLVSEGVRRGAARGPGRDEGGEVMGKANLGFPYGADLKCIVSFVIHRSIGVQLWMLLVRMGCVLPTTECFLDA